MLDATPLFRVHGRRRLRELAAAAPARDQEALLLSLVARAKDTRFGRDHGFAEIRSIADFRKRVPLRQYEDFWEDYWKPAFPHIQGATWPAPIPYYATTSGTLTGRSKYIPCSREMVKAHRKGGLDIIVHHLHCRPKSRLLGGRSFMLSGSTGLVEEAPGVHSGDLSAIISNNIPWFVRRRYYPPPNLALISDWEDKIRRLARLSRAEDIRMVAANANWILILLDTMRAEAGGKRRFVDVYPNLEVIVHGGVSFEPYRAQFHDLLEGSHAETREVFAASEAFVAVADRGDGEGMRLLTDAGVVYEFVPQRNLDDDDPPRLTLDEVELGEPYALVVSSCAGLWAYVVGDLVRFVERDPPRILFAGRAGQMLNAFGEHVAGSEVEHAVAHAAGVIGANVIDFTVAPVFPEGADEVGRHAYVVEFANGPPETGRIAQFAAAVDAVLLAGNEDYEDHRARGFGVAAPEVRAVPPGTFAAWMKSRGKLGGQNKVPRVINDTALFQSLEAIAEGRRAAREEPRADSD